MSPAARRMRIIAGLAAAGAAFAIVLLTVRPALVQRWNIYASATGAPGDAYSLFLGPFPTASSCEVEARIIVTGGGHAYCDENPVLELGSAHQALLLDEFWPSARWIGLCKVRPAARPLHSLVRS